MLEPYNMAAAESMVAAESLARDMVLRHASFEADDAPTLDPAPGAIEPLEQWVPVLTLVAHPETLRLGQRARLTSILVRRPVRLSRSRLEFSNGYDPSGRPLLDTSVSRTELIFSAGGEPGSLVVDPNGTTLRVDGSLVREPVRLSQQRLVAGVQLGLSSRVGLLLRLQPDCIVSRHDPALIGDSPPMSLLRRSIERAAASKANVLILGESGVGKELVAAAVHRWSPRGLRPLVAVNMATVTDSTAASQLFGHQRGAFTGAESSNSGVFELANGGTLFLDEIADATPAVQAMLLRAIESSRIVPLGSTREREVDVRFIAATEVDVLGTVRQTGFRPALAQRLAGIVLRVPALRDRADDIPRLLVHFLSVLDSSRKDYWLSGAMSDRQARLPAEFMFQLLSHSFPGNVRELRNIGQQLLTLGHVPSLLKVGTEVPPASRAAGEAQSVPRVRTRKRTAIPAEEALHRALAESDWSPARAARLLEVPNSTLHYWMKQKGIARRASEIPENELRSVAQRERGDIEAMSRVLCVSERALRLRLARDLR